MSITLNHVNQQITIILTIDITLMAVLMLWFSLLVILHFLVGSKVLVAAVVGAFDGGLCCVALHGLDGCRVFDAELLGLFADRIPVIVFGPAAT